MLFTYQYIHNHPTRKLNQHLKYFFRKLRNVNSTSNFLPLNQHFHPQFIAHLNVAPKLFKHFEVFFNAFKMASKPNRELLLKIFFNSQNIKYILETNTFNGNEIKKDKILPQKLRTATSALFGFMYPGTLDSMGDLTDHYTKIYNSLPSKVCPFCGVELMQKPHKSRQDYDHALSQKFYSFSTVNMNNLAPMGNECNRTYKKAKDVLYNGTSRRIYAYPYSTSFDIEIILDGSLLPDRNANFDGDWVVNFIPNNDYVTTWAEVFDLRYRYGEFILSTHFDSWVGHFIDNLKGRVVLNDVNELKTELLRDANIALKYKFIENNIIKGALYKFLANCNDVGFYNYLINAINNN